MQGSSCLYISVSVWHVALYLSYVFPAGSLMLNMLSSTGSGSGSYSGSGMGSFGGSGSGNGSGSEATHSGCRLLGVFVFQFPFG